MSDSKFVGVDGFSCGWFSVGFNNNGEYELKPFFSFVDLLAYYDTAKLILVDTPIGLTNGPEKRLCDTQARKRLDHASSSVFRPPHRLTAYHAERYPIDYSIAKKTESHYAKIGLQTEAFGIAPKVAEVDWLMSPLGSRYRDKVREVHPEICFWAFNSRRAVRPKKEGEKALRQRIQVLRRVERRAEDIVDEAWSRFHNNCVNKYDILDALVAAVTAYQGWPCELQMLPEAPERDEGNLLIQDPNTGLPMEMVFWEPSRRCRAVCR